ncbi:MAG: type I phosphomannose isomerase catalytic subunit [Flavobacteriaceae bacterium]
MKKDTEINYPIKFKPILKERIWGGNKLMTLLHKESDKTSNIGESWEISDVEGDTSIVVNGSLKGKSLKELLETYKDEFVGRHVYEQFGNKFPLLIKYIDAKEALSIQLHPNDELSKSRHNSFGKTEMWYIMQAEKGGNLVVGFKKDSNREEYLEHLESKKLLDILNVDEVKEGDVYFIPTGQIHAIGAGVLLAEIQQTSDITYRIYDWDRVDDNGNSRELHTELALDAIDFKAKEKYSSDYTKKINKSSNIIECQYFTTNILPIEKEVSIDTSSKNSFKIYMCVEGEASFTCGEHSETISMGETVLIPASVKKYTITATNYAELLEIYIK